MRETCEAQLADIEGADVARVAASANDVLGLEHIPAFLKRMDGFNDNQKAVVLGALARQLGSLPHLTSHDFFRICENFHEQSWPPAAASYLMTKVGWIPDKARQNLTALSLRRT
jgi:hypothetical protein